MELNNNFPKLTYEIPESCRVELNVYDLKGVCIQRLVSGFETAGTHSVRFDGAELSSGLYFYRLSAGEFTDVKRMLLIK